MIRRTEVEMIPFVLRCGFRLLVLSIAATAMVSLSLDMSGTAAASAPRSCPPPVVGPFLVVL